MSQCLYTKNSTPPCRSASLRPSTMDAWLSASENTAVFSSFVGLLPADSNGARLPIATIKAILATNPEVQSRQAWTIQSQMLRPVIVSTHFFSSINQIDRSMIQEEIY